MNAINKFIRDEDGVTTIEYVMLAAGVVVVIVAVMAVLEPALTGKITTIIGSI